MLLLLYVYSFIYICFSIFLYIYVYFIKRENKKHKLRKMGQNKKDKYIRIYRYKYIRNKGLKYKTLAKKRTKTDKMGRNREGEHKMNIYLYV